MKVKAPADSEDIKMGVEVSSYNDIDGWGIEDLIKRAVFSKRVEIEFVDIAFKPNPKECEWINEDPSPWPWVLYLQGTLTLKIKVKQPNKYGPDLQGVSTITIADQLFPLGTDTYEELRSLVPPKKFNYVIQKLIWWMEDVQGKWTENADAPKWVDISSIERHIKQGHQAVFTCLEDAAKYMQENVSDGYADFRVTKRRA